MSLDWPVIIIFFYLSTWLLTFLNFNNFSANKAHVWNPCYLHLMEILCHLSWTLHAAAAAEQTDTCQLVSAEVQCPNAVRHVRSSTALFIPHSWPAFGWQVRTSGLAWGSCPRCWKPLPQELTVILVLVCSKWTFKT